MENKRRVFRFAFVGSLNTLIDFGLLFILKSLGLPVVAANIISSTTAFVFSFFANKKYTFRSTGSNVLREMVLFIAVTLFGLWVLQNLVIYLTLPWFTSLTNQSAALFATKLLATGVSLVWNYLLYSTVVFPRRRNAP